MKQPRRTIVICLSVAIPVGTAIGAAYGATTDNMIYWLGMGAVIGTVIFLVLASRATGQNEGNGPSGDLTNDTSEE